MCVCLKVTLPCKCTGDTKLNIAPLWPAGLCYLKQWGEGDGVYHQHSAGVRDSLMAATDCERIESFSEGLKYICVDSILRLHRSNKSPIRPQNIFSESLHEYAACSQGHAVPKNTFQNCIGDWVSINHSRGRVIHPPVSGLLEHLWQRSIMVDEVIAESRWLLFPPVQ